MKTKLRFISSQLRKEVFEMHGEHEPPAVGSTMQYLDEKRSWRVEEVIYLFASSSATGLLMGADVMLKRIN